MVVHTIFCGCVFNGHFFILIQLCYEPHDCLQVVISLCEWECVQASAAVLTSLLTLESLSSYSEAFMLLIKFMAHMTSAGNNDGDLLPLSHLVDICNLYTAVSSV